MSLRACKVPTRIKVLVLIDLEHVKKDGKFDPHWFDVSVPNVMFTYKILHYKVKLPNLLNILLVLRHFSNPDPNKKRDTLTYKDEIK